MTRSTATIATQAVQAAREGADDQILKAMLDSARQQDEAQRWMMRIIASLLAASMLVNVLLVAWVLGKSLQVSGFGVDVNASSAGQVAP